MIDRNEGQRIHLEEKYVKDMIKPTKEPLILIDAGHGGVREGEYTAPYNLGKQYQSLIPEVCPAPFLEGLINRSIAAQLQFELSLQGIKSHFVFDSIRDLPLRDRCDRANAFYDKYFCMFISIHFNASQHHNAEGFEVFVSNRTKTNTVSRQWATNTVEFVESLMPYHKIRREFRNRDYKAANHYVTRHTKMPAILVEGEFFDTREGQLNITNTVFMRDLVTCYAGGIAKTLSNLNIIE